MTVTLDYFISKAEQERKEAKLEDIFFTIDSYDVPVSDLNTNSKKGSDFERYFCQKVREKIGKEYTLIDQLNTGIYRLDGVVVKRDDYRTLRLLQNFDIKRLNQNQREFYILELKNFREGKISMSEFYKHYGINKLLNPKKYIFILNNGDLSKEMLATHRIAREEFYIVRLDGKKTRINKGEGIDYNVKKTVRDAIIFAARWTGFEDVNSLDELIVQMKLGSNGLAKAITLIDLLDINVVLIKKNNQRNIRNYIEAMNYINEKYGHKLYISDEKIGYGKRLEMPIITKDTPDEVRWEMSNKIYGHYVLTDVHLFGEFDNK